MSHHLAEQTYTEAIIRTYCDVSYDGIACEGCWHQQTQTVPARAGVMGRGRKGSQGRKHLHCFLKDGGAVVGTWSCVQNPTSRGNSMCKSIEVGRRQQISWMKSTDLWLWAFSSSKKKPCYRNKGFLALLHLFICFLFLDYLTANCRHSWFQLCEVWEGGPLSHVCILDPARVTGHLSKCSLHGVRERRTVPPKWGHGEKKNTRK